MYAIGYLLGYCRNDGSPVAMPDQRNALEITVMDETQDIGGMGLQSYLGGQQMRPLSETGQGRRDHGVTGRSKRRRDTAPAPAAKPCTGDE
jgi:hypothetical protein